MQKKLLVSMFEDYPYLVPVTSAAIHGKIDDPSAVLLNEIEEDFEFDGYAYYFKTHNDRAKFMIWLWSIGVDP